MVRQIKHGCIPTAQYTVFLSLTPPLSIQLLPPWPIEISGLLPWLLFSPSERIKHEPAASPAARRIAGSWSVQHTTPAKRAAALSSASAAASSPTHRVLPASSRAAGFAPCAQHSHSCIHAHLLVLHADNAIHFSYTHMTLPTKREV